MHVTFPLFFQFKILISKIQSLFEICIRISIYVLYERDEDRYLIRNIHSITNTIPGHRPFAQK